MTVSGDEHSIEHEPHLSGKSFEIDPSERHAHKIIRKSVDRESLDDLVDHTVWDEPGLAHDLAGSAPDEALTYSSWLAYRCDQTGVAKTWFVTVLVSLMAGPIAVLTAFAKGAAIGESQLVMLTVFGPLIEEIGKVAILLWVIEKRPFFYYSRQQIGLCALAAGFCFSVIENLLYLNIYIPNPTPEIIFWRWTVCVGLHCGCSTIAGIGLQNVWTDTMHHRKRPQLLTAAPYILTAIVIHGVYNGAMVLLEWSGFFF